MRRNDRPSRPTRATAPGRPPPGRPSGVPLGPRAGATTIACRLVVTPLLRPLGRPLLLTVTCPLTAVLCAGVALPVPVRGARPDDDGPASGRRAPAGAQDA
ncbi:hypothetical protein ACWDZX_35545, partial [Streptomyces collinus]